MKKTKSALRVNRETLHLLDRAHLQRLAAGTFTNGPNCRTSLPCSYTNDSAPPTCLGC